PALLTGFDVLLHASRWEGLPRAVVQALLTGIPAVTFDNDGAPEVVFDHETGILVPLGRTDRLAEGVLELAADPALRTRLGVAGRRLCLDRFDWRTMVDELDVLYRTPTEPPAPDANAPSPLAQ
ncbi:MAG: glycosyltransferase, partial [Planctomycetota bacterium]